MAKKVCIPKILDLCIKCVVDGSVLWEENKRRKAVVCCQEMLRNGQTLIKGRKELV